MKTKTKTAHGTALKVLPSAGFRSILVPLDFSPGSQRALALALPFARQFGAKVTLLHVIEPVATPDFATTFPLALENDEQKAAAKKELDRLLKGLGPARKQVEKTLVRFGRSYHEIAEAARTLKLDLIIISTH